VYILCKPTEIKSVKKFIDFLYFNDIIQTDKFFGARCKSLPTVKVRERFGA